MRKMIKRLLKKYDYPPKDRKDAVEIVISQCELWADNEDMIRNEKKNKVSYFNIEEKGFSKVAEISSYRVQE